VEVTVWDPQVYLEFADHRTRPARDLLAAVPLADPGRIVDLGCGTGTSTRLLAARRPDADTLGLDSSPEMIAAARELPTSGVRYGLADIADWTPEHAYDLIFTNAALQWVPGHLDLLPGWLAALTPGGRLALQVPTNWDQPAHTLMRELCRRPGWRDRLAGVVRHHEMPGPADYLDRLGGPGEVVDVGESTYQHRLAGPNPVLEWVLGTALRPVLAALADDPPARDAFEAEYAAALRAAYPPDRHGLVTWPFRRLFVVAGNP
jgi:trans-aconitate 2-methyltransferase